MFSFNPYAPEIDANPFPAYKVLRDEYPCFWSAEANMWVLSRYADIATALNDWQTYSSSSGNLMDELPNRAGSTLGTTDPPRHDRLRGLIQHAFTRRNLEALGEPVRQLGKDRLAALRGRKQFDFVEDFSSKVTTQILFALLGLPPGDDQIVREKAVLMVQSDPVTRAKGPQHIDAYNWMTDYAGKVLQERKRNPGNDLMSLLVQAEIDGDRLLDREVLLTSTTLIMAGIESLGGMMTMFALNLADYPEARARMAADPSLITEALEESLRFNTSAQRFKRCIRKDTELHGQVMKAGDFVCLAYGSANRDDRKYPNPDVYDIDRKPRAHFGFGGGVHSCLGTMVARMALKVLFEEFLHEFPDFSRAEKQLRWMPSSTFRSPLQLNLVVN